MLSQTHVSQLVTSRIAFALKLCVTLLAFVHLSFLGMKPTIVSVVPAHLHKLLVTDVTCVTQLHVHRLSMLFE